MPYLEAARISTWWATAAPPASATAARCPKPVAAGGAEGEPGGGRRAQRQPQLRRPHQSAGEGQLPGLAAAGGGVRAGRDAWISIWRTSRSGTDSDGKPVYLRDIWPTNEEVHADRARVRSTRTCSSTSTRRPSRATRTGRPCRCPPAASTSGTSTPPTSRSRRTSTTWSIPKTSVAGPARHARAGAAGRFRHHRPHLAGRLDSQGQPGRPLPDRARRAAEGLQLLRRAARQPRSDGARHARQHPAAQPAGARHRGRLDARTCPTASRCPSTTPPCATSRKACRW